MDQPGCLLAMLTAHFSGAPVSFDDGKMLTDHVLAFLLPQYLGPGCYQT